jgi:hypothetical protein
MRNPEIAFSSPMATWDGDLKVEGGVEDSLKQGLDFTGSP